MTVNESEFSHSHRQISVTVRLALVYHNAAGAVHRFYAIDFVVDYRRIHIVLIVIPMSAGLPKVSVHYHRSGYFDVIVSVMDFSPIVDKRVLYRHTFRQEERESRSFVAEHKELHFLPYSAVVAFFRFFDKFEIIVEFLLGSERRALNTGEHFVVFIVFPIRSRLSHYLERL